MSPRQVIPVFPPWFTHSVVQKSALGWPPQLAGPQPDCVVLSPHAQLYVRPVTAHVPVRQLWPEGQLPVRQVGLHAVQVPPQSSLVPQALPVQLGTHVPQTLLVQG